MNLDYQSQKSRVIQRLSIYGEVDNFWAIDHYILRLGAIIFQLKKEGWVLEGKFGKQRGFERPLWKNFYYIQVKENSQVPLL